MYGKILVVGNKLKKSRTLMHVGIILTTVYVLTNQSCKLEHLFFKSEQSTMCISLFFFFFAFFISFSNRSYVTIESTEKKKKKMGLNKAIVFPKSVELRMVVMIVKLGVFQKTVWTGKPNQQSTVPMHGHLIG